MNYEFYAQLLATVLVGAGGWIAVHRFTSARDLKNTRRELRTEKLIEIYEKLDRSAQRAATPEAICDIEDAVGLLQLLGTQHDIDSTIELAKGLGGDHPTGLDIGALVRHLRNVIREELGLEPAQGPIAYIRLTFDGVDPRTILYEKASSTGNERNKQNAADVPVERVT